MIATISTPVFLSIAIPLALIFIFSCIYYRR
jgi:hypothetical protein